MNTLLTRSTAALVLAITGAIAAQHIVHAKSLPGEGFTAGALMLLALLLFYVVQGYEIANRRFPVGLFAGGLSLGVLSFTGLLFGPVMAGNRMLESFEVDILGVKLSSTLLFDTGLFLVVVSSLLLAVHGLRGAIP